MGDSNQHNHKRVPFFIAGRAGGALKGGVHLRAPNGTPLANVMLGVLRALGCEDIERFGDSEGAFDLQPDVTDLALVPIRRAAHHYRGHALAQGGSPGRYPIDRPDRRCGDRALGRSSSGADVKSQSHCPRATSTYTTGHHPGDH